MQCQKCKKKQATVHMTEISGDEKEEIHLCEECAQEHGLMLKGQVSLADFLAGLIKAPVTQEMARLAKLQCPSCGISYIEFQSKGRFGCEKDYEVFSKLIAPLLEKVHGAVEHIGKVPARTPGGETAARLATLRRLLKTAVDDEKYEEAAQLRDEIRKIEGGQDAS
jgi:protein arginine kinase activator